MWGNFNYVSVDERKRMAAASAKKLEKTTGILQPLMITGRKIAKSWWGIAWNNNIESYADYSNRLPRGCSFLKNGTILHLSIDKNTIFAYIQGSYKKPYEVEIKIDKLDDSIHKNMTSICKNNLHSIQELLDGSFPDELRNIFTKKDKGLFPTNKQIHFSCSCPDGAYLCKHVAAALYGVSVRLDCDPLLFFKLRDIDINTLISDALTAKSNDLFSKASSVKSKRIIKDRDVQNIFGIDFE